MKTKASTTEAADKLIGNKITSGSVNADAVNADAVNADAVNADAVNAPLSVADLLPPAVEDKSSEDKITGRHGAEAFPQPGAEAFPQPGAEAFPQPGAEAFASPETTQGKNNAHALAGSHDAGSTSDFISVPITARAGSRNTMPVSSVRWMSLDGLFLPPGARQPPAEILAALQASLLDDGWTQPLVIAPSREIIDGGKRFFAACHADVRAMTDGMVPVVVVERPDAAASRARHAETQQARTPTSEYTF